MTAPPRRAGRPAALAFILITVALDVLAFGIIIPVLPKLVEQFLHGDTRRAAEMYGLFGTTWALMQFVSAPIIGGLSDRFGRRPVLLLALFGLGCDYLLMAFAPTLGWLFAGRVVSGITGASWGTAGAYVADVTPVERRAAAFGMIGAAWGFGFVVGPALGGVLGGVDPRLPFRVAAALTLLNALYGLFVLPESLPAERRSAFSWRRANPVGALRILREHAGLPALAAVALLYYIAHQALPSVMVLYTGYRYGWDERTVGLTLAGVGVANIMVQGGLVRHFVARFGERAAMMGGLTFGGLGFLVYALSPSGVGIWASIPVFSLIGLYGPGMQSLMTRRVGPSDQGKLQGVLTSIQGISGLIGPGLFTLTFAAFIGPLAHLHLPGAPFLLAALLHAVALGIVVAVTRPVVAPAGAAA